MSKSKKSSIQRTKLWKENPHCYYCGILTVPPELRTETQKKNHFNFSNMATLEHLYSRLNPKRQEKYSKARRHVLACYKCNSEKALEDTNLNFIEEHRKRSNKTIDKVAI